MTMEQRASESYSSLTDTLWYYYNSCAQQIGQLEMVVATTSDSETDIYLPEIITSRGYPVEVYDVQTLDGYILQLHRIPHGKCPDDSAFGPRLSKWGSGISLPKWSLGPTDSDPSAEETDFEKSQSSSKDADSVSASSKDAGSVPAHRPVVLLMHGLLDSAECWTINSETESAAFLFADAGFDVWLGNFRGNYYSKRHVRFDPVEHDRLFWDFSFDEMGKFDVPAIVDKVLSVSKCEQIYYVGHSMGINAVLATLSEQRDYNKIKAIFALAPAPHIHRCQGLIKYISKFSTTLTGFYKLFGGYEFIRDTAFTAGVRTVLRRSWPSFKHDFTKHVIFLVTGPDVGGMDVGRVEHYLSHLPSGASVASLAHMGQVEFTAGVRTVLRRSWPSFKPDFTKHVIFLVTGPDVGGMDVGRVKHYLSHLPSGASVASLAHMGQVSVWLAYRLCLQMAFTTGVRTVLRRSWPFFKHDFTKHVIFLVTGPDVGGMDVGRVEHYLSHLKSGASVASLAHMGQVGVWLTNKLSTQMEFTAGVRTVLRRSWPSFKPDFTKHVIFLVTGPDVGGMDVGRVEHYLSHLPSGALVASLAHMGQVGVWLTNKLSTQMALTAGLRTVLRHSWPSFKHDFTKHVIFLVTGPDVGDMDVGRVEHYLSHLPSGASVASLAHMGQLGRTGKFQKRDLGYYGNYRKYGSFTPPEYQVSHLSTPMHVYYGSNDWLANPRDVREHILEKYPNVRFSRSNTLPLAEHRHLATVLRELGDLIFGTGSFRRSASYLLGFNHLDFTWGLRAAEFIYNPIIELISNDWKRDSV